MARPLRLEFGGALYHVTSPGDGKEDIYFCDEDRRLFLNVLGKACGRYNCCHAFCLMTNHYHLGGRRFAAISHYRQLVLEGIHSPNPWEGLKNRDAAMFHAYCSGGYKQREIAHKDNWGQSKNTVV